MTTVDREFIGDFLKALGVLVFVVAIVVLIDFFLDFLEEFWSGEGVTFFDACLYYFLVLPRKVVVTISVASAAALIWVISKKVHQNEILAYCAGGISPLRLSMPLLGAALAVSLAAIAVGELVVPPAEREAKRIKYVLKSKDPASLTRNDRIYQKGVEDRFYIIESFDSATGTMISPTIVERHRERNRPAWILRAEKAWPRPDLAPNEWEFQNASVRELSLRGEVTLFEQYDRVLGSDLGRPMEPQLAQFLGELDDPDMMSFPQLLQYVRLLESQNKVVSEEATKLHLKLAVPLATIVIALLMCAHVMRASPRGVLIGFGGGLAWVVSYYIVLLGCKKLGFQGTLASPALAAWLPNVAFGLIGLVSLIRRGAR